MACSTKVNSVTGPMMCNLFRWYIIQSDDVSLLNCTIVAVYSALKCIGKNVKKKNVRKRAWYSADCIGFEEFGYSSDRYSYKRNVEVARLYKL